MSFKFHGWRIASVFSLLFTAIAIANPYAGINDDPSQRLVFAMDPFEKPISHSYSLGDAKEQVLRRFGEPVRSSVSTRELRWPGETQTSYELIYADTRFVLGRWNEEPSTFLELIEITGNAHDLKYGIRIGTPRAEVVSLFAPMEHLAAINPMIVYIPTLETQRSFEKPEGKFDGYAPALRLTFEFDENDCLSRLTILSAADE